MSRLRSFHDWLIESLKDPKEAEAYLKAALSEDDPDLLQKAIIDVIEAGNNSIVISLASDIGMPKAKASGSLELS